MMKLQFRNFLRVTLLLSLLIGFHSNLRAETSEFSDTKRKIATVAIFGLAGAGIGLLTVASSTEPQGRLGNVSAGLLLGAVIGVVYVFNTGNQVALAPQFDSTKNEAGLLAQYRF